VLDEFCGEGTITELCRRKGIVQSIYYKCPKGFLETSKCRLSGYMAWAASAGEVAELHHEARELKEVVSKQALNLPRLKKES